MPFEYRLDHARQRLTIIGRDPAGVPDVLAWLDRQAADGAWAFGSLDDLRLVTLNPTSADVQRILDQVTTRSAVHGPRGPVAVVATHPVLFSMASLYARPRRPGGRGRRGVLCTRRGRALARRAASAVDMIS
jgi:hypothetical protein